MKNDNHHYFVIIHKHNSLEHRLLTYIIIFYTHNNNILKYNFMFSTKLILPTALLRIVKNYFYSKLKIYNKLYLVIL